jgi:Secretion system C-terminal sorting domain
VDNRGTFEWRYINKSLFDQNGVHPIVAIPTKDGGYIYGGSVHPSETLPSDFIVEKLDQNGLLVWSRTIKGNQDDRLNDIQEIREGLYLIAGTSESNIGMDKTKRNLGEADYWFLTLEDTTTTVSSVANVSANKISNKTPSFGVYPNPAKDVLHVRSEGEHTVVLINQNGKEVLRTSVNGNTDVNISNVPAGMYYIKDNTTGSAQKIVITK